MLGVIHEVKGKSDVLKTSTQGRDQMHVRCTLLVCP